MKFQTIYNRSIDDIKDGEIIKGKHMTVPDQALTVAELVYRFSHGQSLGATRTPMYDDLDPDAVGLPPNWEKLDLAERFEFMQEKQQEIKDISDRLAAQKNKLAQDQREAELERRVNAKINAVREEKRKALTEKRNSNTPAPSAGGDSDLQG